MQGNLAGLPDDRFHVQEIIGVGDWTVGRYGQVGEEHVYYDLYGILAQLGQVPPLTATS